jgi:uncharacterized protein YciI
MTHLVLTLAFFLLGFGNPGNPAETPAGTALTPAPQDTTPPAAFVTSLQVYKVGIIRKGAKWTADGPAKLKEFAQKNAEPWRAAIIEGSLVGVANITDPDEIISVLFFKKQTDESMKALAANAPAVKAGLVKAEVQEVWGTQGMGVGLAAKAAAETTKAPVTKETYYLVYTMKGKNWSADSESPETRKSTNDQIRYLAGLQQTGSMKYFGAFTDISLHMRGFGIFKAASDKEALGMMANSPAVKSGALDVGVKTVEVAEGTFK